MEEPTQNFSKLAVPISVALAAGWAISMLVYGAGAKVGSSDKDIAYLVSRMDTLQNQVKDLNEKVTSSHDAVIRLDQRVVSLEASEAGKDIRISMGDEKKK